MLISKYEELRHIVLIRQAVSVTKISNAKFLSENVETVDTVETVETAKTAETVETVETAETVETVKTEDLQKYNSLTHLLND